MNHELLGPQAAALLQSRPQVRNLLGIEHHQIELRLALGGVGTIPWRAPGAERVLNGSRPSAAVFQEAAEAAITDPFTVPGTAFKVELAKRTLVRILQTVSGASS